MDLAGSEGQHEDTFAWMRHSQVCHASRRYAATETSVPVCSDDIRVLVHGCYRAIRARARAADVYV